MRGYVIKRTLATIPVMAVMAVFVFGLLRLTPGIRRRSSRAITPTPRTSSGFGKNWG
jgi:ABC-type dipeptide/oligopeptide/nickel transport system permease component